MKQLKTNGVVRDNDTVHIDEIEPLTVREIKLYQKEILPLLQESKSLYQNLI